MRAAGSGLCDSLYGLCAPSLLGMLLKGAGSLRGILLVDQHQRDAGVQSVLHEGGVSVVSPVIRASQGVLVEVQRITAPSRCPVIP